MDKRDQERELLVSVLDNMPLLISVLDRNRRYKYINNTYLKWHGVEPSEFVGKTIQEVLDPSASAHIASYLDRVEAGEQVHFELEYDFKVVGKKHVAVDYLPRYGGEGLFSGTMVVVRDLTQLRESERRLTYALEATGEGVWDWNVVSNSIQHNVQWAALLGLGDGALQHDLSLFSDLLHPDDAPEVTRRLQRALDGHESYVSEHRLRHQRGHWLWVLDRGRIVERDAAGKPLRMVGSFRDITESREQQMFFMQTAKMVSLGEMASGIAHEINNPLSVIIASAERLREQLTGDPMDMAKLERNVKRIEETGSRISKIVKSLRSLSRDSGQDPKQSVLVQTIIDETLEFCRERFHIESIDLRVNCDPNAVIDCRPGQISQVLLNLLSNAADAVSSFDQKWVQLDVALLGDQVLISVTDSGKGIPEQIATKIMQPFFTTKEVGRGTGLGLSISRGLIEGHDGELRLDRKHPRTRFLITLPGKRASAA